jgi:2-methylcitrate dehydratase PrpD
MSYAAESTAIEALSNNVINTRFETFDTTLIESIKSRIIDVIGCAIGGANAPANLSLVKLIKKWGGEPESSIWVHGGKAPAYNTALVNSVMTRSYDFEEGVAGPYGTSHQNGTVIPTAIAMGESTGASGKEFLTALIAGCDAGNRILRGFDFDFLQGFDGIGTVQVFAATAIAGRLLGLNGPQMINAFGIVLTQTSGTIQDIWDGATTFKLPQGLAARNGIYAAELAKAGWTGAIDALQSRFGYYNLYTHGCTHPETIIQDLGKTYFTYSGFKRYPCGGPTHQAIEGALELFRKYNIQVEDIEEVTLLVNHVHFNNYYAKPWKIRDFPHGDAIFSLQYAAATAMLRGHVRLEDFSEDSIRDPEINDFIKKIKIEELPEDKAKDLKMPVETRIKMKNGQKFSELFDKSRSGAGLMSKDEIIAKFWYQVEFSKTISRIKATKLLESIERLEEVDNINKITPLMVS